METENINETGEGDWIHDQIKDEMAEKEMSEFNLSKMICSDNTINATWVKEFIRKLKEEMKNSVEIDDSWEGVEHSIDKLAGPDLIEKEGGKR